MKTFIIKNGKVTVLFLVLFSFIVSCTTNSNEASFMSVAQESNALKSSLVNLSLRFDSIGEPILSENLTGNLLFDFGFTFKYPIALSYNNGAQVTTNNLNSLLFIIKNTNENLYIDGIVFPFAVEHYEIQTKTIETATIFNEIDFENLLEKVDYICSCQFLSQQYNPTCIKITDTLGEIHEVQFFDELHASYFGFEPSDFIACEEICYLLKNLKQCFDFNYPISIVNHLNEIVIVDTDEVFCEMIYMYYYTDFVYPFTVLIKDDNGTLMINNSTDFENLLNSCD